MSIEVRKPGLLTTVQDLGRYGLQRYGVVAGGAMDEWSHRIANALVGNPEGEATLEITLTGPTLVFREQTLVALCGADLGAEVGRSAFPLGRPVLVRAGTQLAFGRTQVGCRAYLAVQGGFDVPSVLGSKSTYARAGLGGVNGRALRAGDVLAIGAERVDVWPGLKRALESGKAAFSAPRWSVATATVDALPGPRHVRVIAGPQWGAFPRESLEEFLDAEFRIGPNSDRMGYRLSGPPILPRRAMEMISEAVCFGTVQVPPDGNPIILMADRQTTGGYPKIAQVAAVDLPVLAQQRLLDRVRFSVITLDEAQTRYLERERDFAQIRQSVEMKRGA